MSFIMRLLILVMFLCVSSLFASIGKVSLLKGEASLERAGQKLSLKNGIGIEEKDTIRTSKDAQIQLIFEDKTVITLGSESEFKVEEYLSETTKPKAKFKFNQGVFKTITGQIGKTAPENFTLETKTATIGIRGTVIGGVVPPPSSSAPDTIFCLGGKITATSRQTGITVNLPTGTMTVVPLNAPPAPPRQTTPQDIQQFNQTLGTPPPPPAPAEGSNPPPAQSSGSSGGESGSNNNSSTQGNSGSGSSGTPAPVSGSSNTPSTPMSMDEAPPAPPAPAPYIPQPQTFVPTAATAAQQTNLQNLTQEVVVQDVAGGLGVPVEEIQQQIASGSPITPPTDPVITPPPPVTPPPTDPVIPPTDPITPPPTDLVTPPTDPITPPPADPVIPPLPPVTPPPTDPVIPPTDPITPPPSGGGGGGGEVVQTCPSGTTGTYPNCVDIPPQTTAYTTLFSDMSASDGANTTVLFPDETTKIMVFDAANGLWKSSDNAYVVTSTDGNFSYINELSGTQTMYVKDLTQSYNPVLFKSFPTDSNASGYLSGISGLNPIASTHYELVTGVKGVMNEYLYAIKYEQNSQYDTRKWEYDSSLKLFTESYHYTDSEISWEYVNNFASLYSDISNPDTEYQTSLIGAINSYQLNSYINFYIHGVPDANQSLKNYGILADGGKWYFTYDKNNPYFSTTVNVYGDLPITDAISTSGEYVPFMKTYGDGTAYPIFTVNKDGYKEMYSIKDFSDISNSMFNKITQNYLLVNTNYVSLDETNTSINTYYLNGNTQNTYQFYKIDENGTLITDSRNGKLVNPLTSNPLNLYVNFHLGDDTYFSGPIDNPLLDNDTLPTPEQGNTIEHSYGIMPNALTIAYLPDIGFDYRKLAIEKASWSDKPSDDSIYVYSDYGSNSNNRDFSSPSKTGTFIKFPTDSDGIMMESYFDVFQERNATSDVVKNYFTGSVTTGRVVSSDENSTNKIILKHFDSLKGVITTDSSTDYGTTHGFYLFNENAQFINADNGGLDNDQTDSETKYSWIAHEEINATTSEAANVNLMKKVTDSSDTYLFTSSFDYNTSFATGSMSGFMIGEDTSINVWMGDISAFDTNASGGRGLLTITSVANDLNITTPISMDGLSQTDASETIPSASFLGEDMQAMIIEGKTINGKTYDFAMATLPDYVDSSNGDYSYQNDYTSWGYWVATEKAPTAGGSYAQGYWVAGYETPVGSMPIAETIYNYNGHVLGTVTNGTLASPIKLDADNSFKANIEFGAANPVTVTEIKFNTMDLGSVYIAEPLVTSTSTISGNTFSASAADGSTALDLKGKFFGPNAEAIGGAWKGTFNSNTLSGTGVFKAIKGQIAIP